MMTKGTSVAAAVLFFGAAAVYGADKWVAPPEAQKIVNPTGDPKGAIPKGKHLYDDRCSNCHGNKGRGDGADGADLDVKPTDFSKGEFTKETDGAVFWKISKGRKPMPGFGGKLSEEDRWALVTYLRTLSK